MSYQILVGDVLDRLADLPASSVHTVVTSPPYWGLRDYGVEGQGGLEETPEKHVEWLVDVFAAVARVLRPDGTAWVNYGDRYAGCSSSGGVGSSGPMGGKRTQEHASHHNRSLPVPVGLKQKDLVGMPWRVAFALQAAGWYLRSDIIWHKPNPMPESCRDRPTKSHEHVFLLAHPESKGRYYYNADAIREAVKLKPGDSIRAPKMGAHRKAGPYSLQTEKTYKVIKGANRRDVWSITTQGYSGAHFATFPEMLAEPCIKAGCPEGGTVLDPFAGSGVTLLVAESLGRHSVGIELNPEYASLARERISAGRKRTNMQNRSKPAKRC